MCRASTFANSSLFTHRALRLTYSAFPEVLSLLVTWTVEDPREPMLTLHLEHHTRNVGTEPGTPCCHACDIETAPSGTAAGLGMTACEHLAARVGELGATHEIEALQLGQVASPEGEGQQRHACAMGFAYVTYGRLPRPDGGGEQ